MLFCFVTKLQFGQAVFHLKNFTISNFEYFDNLNLITRGESLALILSLRSRCDVRVRLHCSHVYVALRG